jgi:hypothetical protein
MMTKASSERPPRAPVKIPNKKARFAEVVNGRAAMQGVLWGSLDWMMSGENIIQQFEDPMYAVAATGVVSTLAVASLITAKDFDDEEYLVVHPRSRTQEWQVSHARIHRLYWD